MYRYIGIEDLIASALISMERTNGNRRVSLQALSDYGAIIVKLMTQSGHDAILLLTKESTYEFVHDYADYFSIVEDNGIEYIELKNTVTDEDLRSVFRQNLTVDLAKALMGEESLAVLKK